MKPTAQGFCKVKMRSCMESAWQCLADNHSINASYCYATCIDPMVYLSGQGISALQFELTTTSPFLHTQTHTVCSSKCSLYLIEISLVSFLQVK